jgi:ankyrin repeat protein
MNLPTRFCSKCIRVLLISGFLLTAFALLYFLSTQIISASRPSLYSTKITPDGRFKAEIWLDPMLTFMPKGTESDGLKPVRVYLYEVSTGKQLNTSKSGIVTNSEHFDVNIGNLENWNGVQLAKSQDPNIQLIHAAIKGDVSEFNKLLPKITPQFRTSHNRTAIHAAVMGKNLQILEKLLQKNIDTNVHDTDGITALEIATEMGDIEAVKLLLKYGANVNISREISQKFNDSSQETWTVTPLLSVLENLDNTELAGILIANGAKVNVRGRFQITPLHLTTKYGNIIIIDRLLKKGADINAQDEFGNTPLFEAITNQRGNSFKTSKLLIERGAKVNIANKAGQTPLMLAASLSDEENSNSEQRQTTQKLRLDLIQLLIATAK